MIKVSNEIKLYEQKLEYEFLTLKSHWNDNNMVVIELDDGTKLTVKAKDLRAAIDNATNNSRF